MFCQPKTMSPAAKRYLVRFFPAMAAYVAVLLASTWLIKHQAPQGPLLWALAIAPAVPIIAVIAIMGLYLREETDEFVRALLVQAMLWGIGVTLAGCTAWGFLENVDLVPHLPLYLVFPIFCGAMGLAQVLIARRYR
jgi:xanthosine utilization system XapX-like protein